METDSKATYYIDGLVNPDEEKANIVILGPTHTQ